MTAEEIDTESQSLRNRDWDEGKEPDSQCHSDTINDELQIETNTDRGRE